LGAGIRYTDEEKDLVAMRVVGTTGFPFNSPTAPVLASTSDDFVGWDVSANFAATENVNLYARVAAASRGPSIQGRILFTPDGVPGDGVTVGDTEDNISGEIGVKSELFDNRLRLNADVYVFQMSDQQLSAVGGAGNTARLVNVDTTNGYGLEVDLDWVPIENLTITAGFSYNDTEWDDPTLTVNAGCGACTVTNPTISPAPFVTLAFIDGNSLVQAPEIVFTGAIRYGIPFGNSELYGTLDWAYQDEARFFLYETVEFEDDFLELGLRVGYTFNDRYEIAVFGRNITDEDNVKSGIDFSNNTGMLADPATWGVLFNARFGQYVHPDKA
jgi:iron complex outermembrane receptor protein